MRIFAAVGRASEAFDRFPIVSQAGLVVIVLGFGADLVARVGPGADRVAGATTDSVLSAHVAVLLGTLLVLIGVVVEGIRSAHADAVVAGRSSDAIR
ncbi:MAG TPA: hypothetical protein VFI28_01745 [Candidatus Limnocylindrales bacterium]|nr:hypothetical protein [Candidatus Limnocylindrales bacterium]